VFCTVADSLGLVWLTTVVPNERLDGVAESDGPGAVPVPERLTLVGPFGSLVAMVSVPLRDPLAAGEKVTLIVQLAPAARLVPQLFVCAKSPLTAIELIDADAFPVLCTVTVCAALVVPTLWLGNVRLDGVTDKVAEEPLLPLGYTSSSLAWPAGQPVFAVKFSRTNRADVDANVIVAELLFVFGSKV
jgi:hypothetical protein